MSSLAEFRGQVREILDGIDPEKLVYDESEFWMMQPAYEYIEYYAYEHRLLNTAIALPLGRGLHNGEHRKSSIIREGVSYRLPYYIHCLMVARMLVNVQMPVPREEEDIILAAALCHDMIEDLDFPNGGRELYTDFHLDHRVYETVRLVSKRRDFTPEEERAFFHGIESNERALLVKLSDRGHNVEDLYNMSPWKVHEYVGETNTFFLPMCQFGIENYPDLKNTVGVLKDKIVTLTESAEILVNRYEERSQVLKDKVEALKAENDQLRRTWKELWEE